VESVGARGSRRAGASRPRRGKPSFAVGGEGQHRSNVFGCQVGEISEDLLFAQAGGEVLQDVVDRNAQAPDARLSAPLIRFDGDQILPGHDLTVRSFLSSVKVPVRLGSRYNSRLSPHN